MKEHVTNKIKYRLISTASNLYFFYIPMSVSHPHGQLQRDMRRSQKALGRVLKSEMLVQMQQRGIFCERGCGDARLQEMENTDLKRSHTYTYKAHTNRHKHLSIHKPQETTLFHIHTPHTTAVWPRAIEIIKPILMKLKTFLHFCMKPYDHVQCQPFFINWKII